MAGPTIRSAFQRAFTAFVVLIAAVAQLAAAPRERAFRLLTTYSTADHDAGSQNFCVAESARGVIYIGNLAGLLEYDGAWWRLIKIQDELPAVALLPLADGRVAVGAVGDFGYIAPDAAGVMQYHSLLSSLKPEERDIQRVYRIHQTAEGINFITHTSIVRWDGASSVTVATRLPEEAGRTFLLDGKIWVKMPEGMQRLAGGRLETIPGGESFKDLRPSAILPWTEGRQLVVVRNEGIFTFDGKAMTPFAPEASAVVKRDTVMSAHRLSDGRAAIVTYRSGVMLLRPTGEIDEVIDQSVGLPEFDIAGSFIARDGSLLLAMENGITRVEVSSALSIIDSRGGMRGGAQAAARHKGVLYVGTTGGLYAVGNTAPAPVAGTASSTPIVTRIAPDLIDSSWALLSLGDEMLVGGGDKIALMQANGTLVPIEGTKDLIAYCFHRSDYDPNVVYAGLADGFGVLRRNGSTWVWGGKAEGLKPTVAVRSIVEEARGVFWLGTTYNGAIQAKVVPAPAGKLKLEAKEFTDDEVGVFKVAGRTVFTAGAPHLLHFDAATRRFVPDPVLGRLGNASTPFVVVEDARRNIWLNTRPVGVASRNAKGEWLYDDRVLVDMPGKDVQLIFPDIDDVIWFGTEKGFVRYDARSARIEAPPRMPLVRQVTVNGVPLKAKDGRFEVAHGSGRIRFEISPVSYEPGLSYQYRLDPTDSGWSSWTNEPFTEFTNLWEGDYLIQIRTRNVRTKVSPTQAWRFTILPPWYRTSWAYALWLALLLLLVAGVSKIRTRSLRNRAAMLEQRVAEQTHELIEKNQALEHANARLEQLSFDDPLTGIPNRRHFEETLRTEWNRAWRSGTTLSFVLMDIDHFKELNDTRGHHVGDECLRQIGTFLEKSLRRSGDFAARYGGEEFALVLPNTDLEGACHMAEQLRAGIEALGIPNPGAPFKVLTSSFGVASVRPNDLSTPDDLIVAADRALYRAKAEGRNRVGIGGQLGQMTA